MLGIFNNNRFKRVHRVISYIDDRTKNILEWIKFFNHRHEEHDKRLDIIEQKLTLIPSEQDIKSLIDMHYLNHDVRNRLNILHGRIENMSIVHQHVPERIRYLHEKIKRIEQKHSLLLEKHEILKDMHKELAKKPAEKPTIKDIKTEQKSHFKEKLIVNLAKNSKNYVKGTIVNLIKKYEKMNGAKIKEIIVDEQKLCSKSSLYRILSEIEQEYPLNVARKGKDKMFSFGKIFAEN